MAWYFKCKQKSQLKRLLGFRDISNESFNKELSRINIPQDNAEIDTTVTEISNILYNCAIVSLSASSPSTVDYTVSRWERLVSDSDDRHVWQARNWQGKCKDNYVINDTKVPTDEEFREFYEGVYNPRGVECIVPNEFGTNVTMSILDDVITINEFCKQVKA